MTNIADALLDVKKRNLRQLILDLFETNMNEVFYGSEVADKMVTLHKINDRRQMNVILSQLFREGALDRIGTGRNKKYYGHPKTIAKLRKMLGGSEDKVK